jgi:hypothetical protein
MKILVIKALTELQKEYNLEKSVMDLFQILTPEELAKLEEVSVEDSMETWGAYRFAVLYNDFPDYLFFELEDYTLAEIKLKLKTWMKWCNIIK